MSASNYIIGGNDEHGQNPPTANKRTPIMLYLERSIYENEFNRPAKIYYFISLLRSGFNVFDVHPEIYDVPISTRVSRANNANITLLVTFAYNAFGSGQSFNSVSGALTFYSERNVFAERSKELSEDVFLGITENSLQTKGLGISTLANVGILQSVRAPSTLAECGFMTNLREARLMLDPAWQKSIAFGATQGICTYMGEPYISEGNPNAYPILRRNSRGNYVKILQYYLTIYGYDVNADGIFGINTESAVKQFQADNGLIADGIVGRLTWAKLLLTQPSANVLRRGSRGTSVYYLQMKLLSKLYPLGNVDSIFGQRTENAVKAFQTESGLTADGIVGPLTWAMINTLDSPRN